MLRTLFSFFAILLCAAAGPAQAVPMVFSQSLAFSTGSQSLWGPGGSKSSFGASGSASVDIPFGPTVGAGYSASASSGTASATLKGNLLASYDGAPGVGTLPIGLDFSGTGGTLGTSLGAHFDVTGFVHDIPFYGPWDPCIYCADYSLDPSASFTPSFGVQRSASDSFGVAGVGPDIGVASAQLTLNANQTAYLKPEALTGVMTYTHRLTGEAHSLPFSISGLSFLDAELDRPGTWDFSFASLDIANTFHTTIGANLSVDLSAVGLTKSFPFSNISLLDTPAFDLDFASLPLISGFAIQVPEPGTLMLMALSLAGIAISGRRR
jgi:hypothetical protein